MRVTAADGTPANLMAAAAGYERSGHGSFGLAAAEAFARAIDQGPGGLSRSPITPDTALGVSALYACTALIVRLISTLPLQTFEEDVATGEARRVRDHQADMLEYQPNPEMAASTVWGITAASLILRGNMYLAKQHNEQGEVVALWPLASERCIPWRDQTGRKWFQVTGADGQIAHYSSYHVLHLKGMSFGTGLEGHSVVSVQRRRLEAQLAAADHQAKLFESGLNVKAVMKVPYELDAQGEQAKQLRRDIRTFYGGASNAGSVMLLEQGVDLTPVSITPTDAQFLEQMRYAATEVCSWLGVPPAEIGADSGGGSLRYETTAGNDLNLLKKCVRYWLRRICDDLFIDPDMFGLGSGRFARFNVDALLEADIMTRFQTYELGTKISLYTPDEIALLEGRPVKNTDTSTMTANELQLALAATKTAATAQQRSADLIEQRSAMPQPVVNVAPAPVNVDVSIPEQQPPVVNITPELRTEHGPAPVVNVNVPEQPTPVVNVDVQPPSVQVDVAAPDVTVAPNITVEQPATKQVTFERDADGNITQAHVKE